MVHSAEGETVGPAAAEVGDVDILHGDKRPKTLQTDLWLTDSLPHGTFLHSSRCEYL